MGVLRLTLLFAALIVFLVGCVSSGWQLNERVDGDSGNQVYETRMNRLPEAESSLILDVRKTVTKSGKAEFDLVLVSGDSRGFVHIPANIPSLFLEIDGKKHVFSTPEKSGWTVGLGVNTEKVIYPRVTAKLIAQMANANSVKVRLVGQAKEVNTEFSPENRLLFAQFLGKFNGAKVN